MITRLHQVIACGVQVPSRCLTCEKLPFQVAVKSFFAKRLQIDNKQVKEKA